MNDIFFRKKTCSGGLRVLTITATFPSLIQPWLVNQLVQIQKHGGENLILARKSEDSARGSSIDRNNLLDVYSIVPESNRMLLREFLVMFANIKALQAMLVGLLRYMPILVSGEFSFKEKIYSLFLMPFMGMRDVDIIHSHSEMAGNRFFPIIYALNKPFVITFHGLPPVGVKQISKAERSRYTKYADVILVNTKFAKQQYIDLGAQEEKLKILPQGINLNEFPFYKRPFPNSDINILTVGRFHPDKGHEYAVRAIAELIKSGFRIKYTLIGDGPEKNKMISLVESLNIEDKVQFHSVMNQKDLQEYYANSHIFILPSITASDNTLTETQGVVIQEAQASGLIVIATTAGGIPECIEDGVSGFLVEERSSETIKDKLKYIVNHPHKWGEYQMNGRKWVESRYDINVIGEQLHGIYRNVLINHTN